MEIRYPLLLLVTLVALIVVWVWRGPKRLKKEDGKVKKVANTTLVKESKAYKKLARKYKIMVYVLLGCLTLEIACTAVLSARLVTVKEIENKVYNRDIILCMDISGSMDEINHEIVDTYDGIVKAMQGERFGISIFNNTSYLLTPLTDDYEYTAEVLGELRRVYEYLEQRGDTLSFSGVDDYKEYSEIVGYLIDGTQSGTGGSKTGDGLASCVYDFPDFETERSRIVILSSDNDVYGEQIVDVVEAANIAKKKGVKVYVLAPSSSYQDDLAELREAVNAANGKLYVVGEGDTVSGVVKEIETTEKTLLEGAKRTVETDHPEVFFVLMVMAMVATAVMIRMLI